MSDYPCWECGREGRGPSGHKMDCSRQPFSGKVCPRCKEIYLYKGDEICEYCVAEVDRLSKDPLEQYWEAVDRANDCSVFNLTRVTPARQGERYEEHETVDPSAPRGTRKG